MALHLPDVDAGDIEVTFVPQAEGKYDIECFAGFQLFTDTMRVVGD